jgi:hypothetical protein
VPLVIKAQIGGYDIDIVFMDAGSGINLIYAKTLRAMHISMEFLKQTDFYFCGIVSGSANYPLGECNNSKFCTQLLSNQVVKFWGKLKLLFRVHD